MNNVFMFIFVQVNLKKGVPPDSINETCTAGAGSLLVEFGMLSRLIGDSTFEWVARRAVRALWNLRSNETGLLGNWVSLCLMSLFSIKVLFKMIFLFVGFCQISLFRFMVYH